MIKNSMIKTWASIVTVLTVVGCGTGGGDSSSGSGTTDATATSDLPAFVQAAIDAPPSVLSEELTNTIAYMGNEERLAYDVYNALYAQYGTKQFINIANNGEYQHITAIQHLVQKYGFSDGSFSNVDLPALGYQNTLIENMEAGTYDISVIQKLYDSLIAQGSTSEIEALKVGCIIEVVDVNDLNEDISLAQTEGAADVLTVFNFLRDGSYNHYWAFDKGLKNKGLADGCCSVGAAYCHPEYPQK